MDTENTLAQDMTLDDKVRSWLCRIIFIATSCLYLYTAGFGSLDEMVQRCLLVLVAGFAVFLTKPFQIKGKRYVATRILDWVFAIAMIVVCVYIMSVWPARSVSTKAKPQLDSIMGTIMIIVLLVATYKTTGWPLVITCVVFLVYALLGPYMPGFLAHRGYTWKRVAETMYVSTQSIFGVPAGIAATYIVCFVIFGSFLETFGAGQWFVDIAFAGAGRFRGGPAKTAILSSALMGMISGSPAANVVTTGTFTIPLMKRMGFKPHVAGAVEAVASTGGMFTPPIMGAAAFMMAEFLNVKYSTVAAAAILPAVLYYLSALLVVDSISVKEHLVGLPSNELPSVKQVMKERGLMGLPILMIIVVILMGWSPMKAAFWATILTFVLSFFSKETRPDVKKFFEALESGTKSVVSIAISCAAAGIIVGILQLTGLATRMSVQLVNLAHGNIYIAALLTALITIVLGCGMPPTPTYVILATCLVRPLTEMGASALSAHMFIFMFACVGALTPPVAITAYTAAAIAKSNPNQTGFTSFRMGIVAYIIPFIFLLNPAILLEGSGMNVVLAAATAILGVFCLTGAIEGYLLKYWSMVARIMLGIGALMMMIPGMTTDLVGIGLVVVAFVLDKLIFKPQPKDPAQA
ncbi:MAG: TRAP transporter permease [Anaerolineaceae bacterium]|nr:TRAP transporter permease [Oscillospiraceae bacterium]MBQ6481483.1 TRAP transporter permease [Anaerolineaceae bacterium]